MEERQPRTQFGKSVKDKIHEIKYKIAGIKYKLELDDITTETLLNNVQSNADAIKAMAEKWANIEKRLQKLEKG